MSVAVLIVAHERVGEAMAQAALRIFAGAPLPLRVVGVPRDGEPDALRGRLQGEIDAIDEGDGVLLLTDLFGSTPSNVAATLVDDARVRMVAGVNLPMLVRVMNYPRLPLPDLERVAVAGGRDGVVACRRPHVE